MERDEDILILILELMKILGEGEIAPNIFLSTPVLSRLNGHMTSKNDKIRELAALNTGSISYNVKGKERVIEARSIPILCNLLFDEISEVRIASTRALTSLA